VIFATLVFVASLRSSPRPSPPWASPPPCLRHLGQPESYHGSPPTAGIRPPNRAQSAEALRKGPYPSSDTARQTVQTPVFIPPTAATEHLLTPAHSTTRARDQDSARDKCETNRAHGTRLSRRLATVSAPPPSARQDRLGRRMPALHGRREFAGSSGACRRERRRPTSSRFLPCFLFLGQCITVDTMWVTGAPPSADWNVNGPLTCSVWPCFQRFKGLGRRVHLISTVPAGTLF